MDSGNTGRSKKVVGLFLAAALTMTPGCSMNPFEWGRNEAACTDVDRDGYCDEDGRPVSSVANRSHRTGFWPMYRYFGGGSSSSTVSKPASSSSRGVSSGSKGGLGSSSRSGGGSSLAEELSAKTYAERREALYGPLRRDGRFVWDSMYGDEYALASLHPVTPEFCQSLRSAAEKLGGVLKRQMSDHKKRRLADAVIPSSLGKRETLRRLKHVLKLANKKRESDA